MKTSSSAGELCESETCPAKGHAFFPIHSTAQQQKVLFTVYFGIKRITSVRTVD